MAPGSYTVWALPPFWIHLPFFGHWKKSSQPSLKLILASGLLHVLGAPLQPTLPTTPKPVSEPFHAFKASITSSTRLSLTTQSKTDTQSLPLSEVILCIGCAPIRLKAPKGQKRLLKWKPPWRQKRSALFISTLLSTQECQTSGGTPKNYWLNKGMNACLNSRLIKNGYHIM